jgi:hypothetical protein
MTPPPTDCYDPELDIVQTIGADVKFPPGAVDIQSLSGGTVTLDFAQLWSDESESISVAVAYYGSTGTNEFDLRNNVEYAVTKSYTIQCFKGYAEFNIYAYVGGNAPESECEVSAQTISGKDVVVYQVEIPCTPCECEPEAKLLNQVGANISLPASVFDISAQNVDTVEFSISQKWKSLSMFALQYYGTDFAPSCDVMGTVPDFESTFTAQCFKGFAEVNIFVYAGDYVAASDCEACAAPGESSSDMAAYTIELPCRPCDWSSSAPTAAPAPTDCYDRAVQLVETIGANIELPPGTVDIQDVNGGTVTFDITQLWSDEDGSMAMGVYYFTESGSPKLDLGNDVNYDVTKTYTAQCFKGYAEFSVYAYVGADAPESECEAASQPISGDSSDAVLYRFEVDCSSCDECEGEANLVRQAGTNISLPAEVVEITAQNVDTVDFDISQLWKSVVSGASVEMLAVQYYTTDYIPTCEQMDTSYEAVGSFSAQCFNGFAEVMIYVYAGSYAPDDCEACSAPEGDSVVYSFELPCRPCDWSTEAPSPAPQASVLECYSGAELETIEGSCSSSVDMPIEILSMDGASVTFALSQTFSASDQQSVAVRYSRFPNSAEDCTKLYDVSSGLIAGDFKATCNADGVAEVSIYTDSGTGTGSCEHIKGENCGYHYVIPCKDNLLCPSSRQRRGLDELEVKEAFFTSAGSVSSDNVPGFNDEDDMPYCVTEDFPCEGEGSDMVFVCHYSARKGYQTFCVPETDSDILRFYPNDYCGPCEGGYGGSLWN